MQKDWVFDSRQYLGHSLFGKSQSERQIFKELLSSPIRKILLYPTKPKNYHLEDANNRVLLAASENRKSIFAVCRVDPWQGKKALVECEKHLFSGNFHALYLDPVEENFPLYHECVNRLMQLVMKLKSRVILNAGIDPHTHPGQWRHFTAKYPEIPFLILNGGQINISGLLLSQAENAFLENKNCYMEFAGVYRNDFVEFLVKKGMGDRICFGSGAPRFHKEFELERFKSLKLTAGVRKKIARENIMHFLGLKDK
ncbi:amidohydrolase family protein [Candidatus Riflebacteria bacterium]